MRDEPLEFLPRRLSDYQQGSKKKNFGKRKSRKMRGKRKKKQKEKETLISSRHSLVENKEREKKERN